jgi:PRTRC genetic system protein E
MFSALQALTQKTTLLIVVAAEGELLRVNITPTSNDTDASHPLHPISLLATPAELDGGFVEALNAWQAPRLSLIEQVEAAAVAAASEEDNDKAKKPTATKTAKPLTAKQAAKAGKTPKPEPEPKTAADSAQTATQGSAEPAGATSGAPAEPGAAPASADASANTTLSEEPIAAPPRLVDSTALPPDAPGDPVAPEVAASGPAVDKFTIDLF